MEARAEARYVRVSAQKARLVVDLIRGQKAGQALTTLRTTNKRIAPTVEKVLQSAIANAQNRFEDVDVDQLVVDLIRGRQAGEAINILQVTKKRVAHEVEKVLRSAIANAENRSEDVDVDALFVSQAFVNEGPRMKRIRPAPMGRAYRYQRRMSHIVIKVAEKEA